MSQEDETTKTILDKEEQFNKSISQSIRGDRDDLGKLTQKESGQKYYFE